MPTKPTPVCIGIPWYAAFDEPVLRGHAWWIGLGAAWGGVRGGHEICLMPPQLPDTDPGYCFDDQGEEGACVGFALSRMMSLLNRQKYDARWLNRRATRRRVRGHAARRRHHRTRWLRCLAH